MGRDPRAGTPCQWGLGSKMGAVLTDAEAARELRGKGKWGWGMGRMFPGGREKGRARSGFLEEAFRNASMLKAT